MQELSLTGLRALAGRRRWVLVGLFLLLIAPALAPTTYILHIIIIANIYAVFAASWDFLSGFTGQLNLGHALFFGAGAYTAALLNTTYDLSPWLTLFAGALVAVLFGLIEGVPCLRLRGPYLAIVTLAFAEIAFAVVYAASSITGGEEGIIRVDSLVRGTTTTKYYASVLFMLVAVAVMYWLARSDLGLILKSIKEDADAAEAAGVNTTWYKLLAFLVSAFFAGLAGAYYTHYLNLANPETLGIPLSAAAITMSLVGGIGTILGPVLGAYVLSLTFDMLPLLASQVTFLTDYRVLVYNVLIVLIILFMPNGLVGWWRARYRREPVPTTKPLDQRPQEAQT